jgi:hypothetical protein
MIRPAALAAALLLAPLPAQAVNDVGLCIDVPTAVPVMLCHPCTPASCQSLGGPALFRGTVRSLRHLGAPSTPFAVAIGLQGPCLPITGIANALMLAAPVVLAVGVTSALPLIATCNQTQSQLIPVVIPAMAPLGLGVRFQSLGMSSSGLLAFSPAIEAFTF